MPINLTSYNIESFSLTQESGRINGGFRMEQPKDLFIDGKIIDKLILKLGEWEWTLTQVYVSVRLWQEGYRTIMECSFNCLGFYVRKLETTATAD